MDLDSIDAPVLTSTRNADLNVAGLYARDPSLFLDRRCALTPRTYANGLDVARTIRGPTLATRREPSGASARRCAHPALDSTL